MSLKLPWPQEWFQKNTAPTPNSHLVRDLIINKNKKSGVAVLSNELIKRLVEKRKAHIYWVTAYGHISIEDIEINWIKRE